MSNFIFGRLLEQYGFANKTAMTKEKVTEEKQKSEETTDINQDQEMTNESNEKKEPSEASGQDKYQELNDRYLRLYSEFENFRRRTAKEKLDLINSAGGKIITDLLPIIDDFERAIKNNATIDDATAIKEGIELIYSKMDQTLKSKGLKEIDALEKDFDLDFHEAITKIPAPTDHLKGKVVDVVEKGYLLNEKVIRYAKVVIGE